MRRESDVSARGAFIFIVRLFPRNLIIFLLFFTVQQACPASSPSSTVREFLRYLVQKQYELAYSLMARGLQEEVSYSAFREEAVRAKEIQVFLIKPLQDFPEFTRLKLKGKILWEENKELVWVVYEGKADLLKENGRWRIMAVDFEPIARSSAGKVEILKIRRP